MNTSLFFNAWLAKIFSSFMVLLAATLWLQLVSPNFSSIYAALALFFLSAEFLFRSLYLKFNFERVAHQASIYRAYCIFVNVFIQSLIPPPFHTAMDKLLEKQIEWNIKKHHEHPSPVGPIKQ